MTNSLNALLVKASVWYHENVLHHKTSFKYTPLHWRDLTGAYDYTCDTEHKFLGRITY